MSCSTDASGKHLWLPASGNATAIEFAGADGGIFCLGTVREQVLTAAGPGQLDPLNP